MYTQFYRLEQKPFALLPDPRFLFLGGPHRDALAALLVALEKRDGVALLLGPSGSGKTTLCCTLLDRLSGRGVDVAFVSQAPRGALELMTALHRSLGLSAAGGNLDLLLAELVEHLRKARCAGRLEILVIDGAHELTDGVFDCVRELADLEEDGRPLLRVLLVGEPALAEHLERAGLAGRVTTRQELTLLDREQCEEYVLHRLRVAGRRVIETPMFKGRALRALHAASRGTPRAINAIADRALALSAERSRERIGLRAVRTAARELRIAEPRPPRVSPRTVRAARRFVVAAVVCGALTAGGLRYGPTALELSQPTLELARPTWNRVHARVQLAVLDLLEAPAYRAWATRSEAAPQS